MSTREEIKSIQEGRTEKSYDYTPPPTIVLEMGGYKHFVIVGSLFSWNDEDSFLDNYTAKENRLHHVLVRTIRIAPNGKTSMVKISQALSEFLFDVTNKFHGMETAGLTDAEIEAIKVVCHNDSPQKFSYKFERNDVKVGSASESLSAGNMDWRPSGTVIFPVVQVKEGNLTGGGYRLGVFCRSSNTSSDGKVFDKQGSTMKQYSKMLDQLTMREGVYYPDYLVSGKLVDGGANNEPLFNMESISENLRKVGGEFYIDPTDPKHPQTKASLLKFERDGKEVDFKLSDYVYLTPYSFLDKNMGETLRTLIRFMNKGISDDGVNEKYFNLMKSHIACDMKVDKDAPKFTPAPAVQQPTNNAVQQNSMDGYVPTAEESEFASTPMPDALANPPQDVDDNPMTTESANDFTY